MRTSTKILIVITSALLIANVFLTKYLFQAITPTGQGFTISPTPLFWVAIVAQILFNIFMGILFFRFLKTQRLTNVIFFSAFPLTLTYAVFMVYISEVKNLNGLTAQSVRATLNIPQTQTSYNNILWAVLGTIVFLTLLFLIVLFACRPLSRVQNAVNKLGDGRIKMDNFKVGGGKQFKEIENSINKINYNYKEKENKIKQTNLESQKLIPKQFFKFLGKNNVEELELGNQVKKIATIIYCNLNNSLKTPNSLSLEENFNYINSYLKIVSPLIRRFDGFVDKYLNEGVVAVFSKPQDAIECSHAILRAIYVKNKTQKDMPSIDTRISIFTGEVIFGIVGEEDRKNPTIISNSINLVMKIDEINQYIGTKLLISKSTLNNLPPKYNFDYRYTGTLSLENSLELQLFESLDYYPKNKHEKLKKLKTKFENGVIAYNEKRFYDAKELFELVLKYIADDKPSYVYFNKTIEKLKNIA